MGERKLTKKQEFFIIEYCKDFNATRAYKEVYGCSQRVAEVNGTKILGNTRVAQKVKKRAKEKLKKFDMTADDVLIGIKKIIDDDDSSKANRIKCFELLGKYFKLFTEKVDLSNPDGSLSGPVIHLYIPTNARKNK